MDLASAIRAVVATFRRRPDDFFPFYMVGLAVPAIAQVLGIIGIASVVAYLYQTGRIAAAEENVQALESPPDPEMEPEAFFEWSEQLGQALEPLFTLPTIAGLGLTILVVLVVVFVLSAGVTAGQLGTCLGRLRGESGVRAGIRAFRRYWRRMTGLYLLEIALWLVLTTAVVGMIGIFWAISPILAIFAAIFLGLVWIAGAVLIRAIFAFAPVAIVAEDRSVFGSLRASVQFIREDFVSAVSYYAVAIGVLVVFSGIIGSFAVMGSPNAGSLGSLLLVLPALHLLKTALYGDYLGVVDPPTSPDTGVLAQARGGLSHSLRETGAFVRDAPLHHVVSIAAMAVGFWIGWMAAEPLVGELQMSISERISALMPITAPLYFFTNNWSVAISLGFAGLGLAVPALVLLGLNGFSFAFVSRLEADPTELIAFVIPHGVIEIPAILIAGAVGLYLGGAFWRTWRGRASREEFAGTLRRCFWVLVGIGILLAVAGLIEGYVSPYYYRPFL